jgi:hypothetical protein
LRRAFLRVAFLPPAFFRRAFFFEAFLRAAILGFTPLVGLLDAPPAVRLGSRLGVEISVLPFGPDSLWFVSYRTLRRTT